MLQPYTTLYSSQIYTQHQKIHEVIMPVCLSQTFNAYSVSTVSGQFKNIRQTVEINIRFILNINFYWVIET